MNLKTKSIICLISAGLSAASTYGWSLVGRVKCPDNVVVEGAVVLVSGSTAAGPFNSSGTSDASGNYFVDLPDLPGSFVATLDQTSLPSGETVVGGASVPFETTPADTSRRVDWTLENCGDTPPPPRACWFTGGGGKIDSILGIPAAEKGQLHSFGGNVYPGCNPDSGEGGNWNHVARGNIKLHFQGKSIEVVDCGNVEGIPPGSTSPVTPYNYIEFTGTGTLKGIGGNKADYGQVTFFARCEDRNEPGSKDTNAGEGIDRYYLRVVDSGGVTRLLVSGSADPTVIAPLEISHGNFQLHISSCDDPPTP